MSDQVLSFEITLENGQFKVSSKEVKKELSDIGASSKTAGDTGATGIQKLTSSVSFLKSLIATAGIAGTAAIIYRLGKEALTAAVNFEMNTVAFETMLKSADKAKNLLADLTKWTAKTPLEMNDAIVGAKRLLAFGVAQEDIIPTLTNLGNAASGNAQTLDTLTLAYGKLAAKGKASMEELNMFTEAGVPLMQALADSIGVSTQELYKMVEQGAISFDDVNAAIEDLTTGTGQFAGMMEKQSATLGGKWSTFKDNISLAALSIGNDMLPNFKALLDTLSESEVVLPAVATLFGIVGKAISILAGAVNLALKGVEGLLRPLKGANVATEIKSVTAHLEELQRIQARQPKNSEEFAAYAEEIKNTTKKLKELQIQQNKYNATSLKNEIESTTIKINDRTAAIIAAAKAPVGYYNVEGLRKNREELLSYYEDLLLEQNKLTTSTENLEAEIRKLQAAGDTTIKINVETTGGGSGKAASAPQPNDDKKETASAIGLSFDKAKEEFDRYKPYVEDIISGIGEVLDQQLQNDLDRIEMRKQAKIDALTAEYEAEVLSVQNSTLSQEKKTAKLKALDDAYQRNKILAEEKAEKEKRKLQRKAAKQQKTIKTIEIVINTAAAIMSAYSQLGPIAGSIYAAIIAGLGLYQIAQVQKQPLPELRTGVFDIPADTLVQLHAGESVIPKTFTDSIKAGEMSLGAGGGTNIYIQGYIDKEGLFDLMNEHNKLEAFRRGKLNVNFA